MDGRDRNINTPILNPAIRPGQRNVQVCPVYDYFGRPVVRAHFLTPRMPAHIRPRPTFVAVTRASFVTVSRAGTQIWPAPGIITGQLLHPNSLVVPTRNIGVIAGPNANLIARSNFVQTLPAGTIIARSPTVNPLARPISVVQRPLVHPRLDSKCEKSMRYPFRHRIIRHPRPLDNMIRNKTPRVSGPNLKGKSGSPYAKSRNDVSGQKDKFVKPSAAPSNIKPNTSTKIEPQGKKSQIKDINLQSLLSGTGSSKSKNCDKLDLHSLLASNIKQPPKETPASYINRNKNLDLKSLLSSSSINRTGSINTKDTNNTSTINSTLVSKNPILTTTHSINEPLLPQPTVIKKFSFPLPSQVLSIVNETENQAIQNNARNTCTFLPKPIKTTEIKKVPVVPKARIKPYLKTIPYIENGPDQSNEIFIDTTFRQRLNEYFANKFTERKKRFLEVHRIKREKYQETRSSQMISKEYQVYEENSKSRNRMQSKRKLNVIMNKRKCRVKRVIKKFKKKTNTKHSEDRKKIIQTKSIQKIKRFIKRLLHDNNIQLFGTEFKIKDVFLHLKKNNFPTLLGQKFEQLKILQPNVVLTNSSTLKYMPACQPKTTCKYYNESFPYNPLTYDASSIINRYFKCKYFFNTSRLNKDILERLNMVITDREALDIFKLNEVFADIPDKRFFYRITENNVKNIKKVYCSNKKLFTDEEKIKIIFEQNKSLSDELIKIPSEFSIYDKNFSWDVDNNFCIIDLTLDDELEELCNLSNKQKKPAKECSTGLIYIEADNTVEGILNQPRQVEEVLDVKNDEFLSLLDKILGKVTETVEQQPNLESTMSKSIPKISNLKNFKKINKLKSSKIQNSKSKRTNKKLSKNSIKVIASSMGISNISDGACSQLSDLAYSTLRLLIETSIMITNKCQRKTLTIEAINKALDILDFPILYGHSNIPRRTFKKIGDVFVPTQPLFKQKQKSSSEMTVIKNYHLKREFVLPNIPKGERQILKREQSQESISYYKKICEVINSRKPSHIRIITSDLAKNPKISIAALFFINYLSMITTKCVRTIEYNCDILQAIHLLCSNQLIDISAHQSARRLANVLIMIITEFPEELGIADTRVRKYASLLLQQVISRFDIDLYQQKTICHHFLQHLYDKYIPLNVQYGALVGLTAFGSTVWDGPVWIILLEFLNSIMYRKQTCLKDIPLFNQIMWDMLEAKERLCDKIEEQALIDFRVYEEFGDAVTPFRTIRFYIPVYSMNALTFFFNSVERKIDKFRLRVSEEVLPKRNKSIKRNNHYFRNYNYKLLFKTKNESDPNSYWNENLRKFRPYFPYIYRNIKEMRSSVVYSAAGCLYLTI